MEKKVCVILSTYNGANYLREQLDSLIAQCGVRVSLLVRDDGSTDGTVSILKEYAEKMDLTWYQGENMGAALSFIDAIYRAKDADFYALCDQDDYWKPEKLISAVRQLQNIEEPAYYCGKTLTVDKNRNPIATVGENVCRRGFLDMATPGAPIGCTMVMNSSLMNVLKQYRPKRVVMHDAWINAVCSAINGVRVFDDTPHIEYRQHDNNVVGGRSRISDKVRSTVKNWNSRAGVAFQQYSDIKAGFYDVMSAENKEKLDILLAYKDGLRQKIKLLTCKEMLKGPLLRRMYVMLRIIFNNI